MKIRIIVSAIILLLLLVANGSAATDKWSWAFIASSNQQSSSTGGLLGTDPLSYNGYDDNDKIMTAGPRAYFAVYHGNDEPGWEGNGGFYSYDKRADIQSQAGKRISWRVNVWADPTLSETANRIYIEYWPVDIASAGIDVWFTLISKPVGVTGGPIVGTSWHLSNVPEGSITLPIFKTTNGLDGYVFNLTATVVPEPSALAALCVGLAGLVIKRMRR